MSWASRSEGLYFPFSRKTMVSRRTPAIRASSSWDSPSLVLSSLMRLFILEPEDLQPEPAENEDDGHAGDAGPDQAVGLERRLVAEVHDEEPKIDRDVVGQGRRPGHEGPAELVLARLAAP